MQGNKQHEMVMGRSPMINFNVLEFITGLLIILFYDDRRFHVRVDVAMIGIGTCFRKRERKGTTGGNDPAIKRRAIVTCHSMSYLCSILPGHGRTNRNCQRLRAETK